MGNLESLVKSLGDVFRTRGEKDRIYAKGKKIEIVYAVESHGIPLFRTEGVGDITRISIPVKDDQYDVVAILPEKVQAKLRRDLLATLRSYYQKFSESTRKSIVERAKSLGFILKGDEWNCFIAPPREGGGEADLGMCGFCPACTLLGTILTKTVLSGISTSYGVKSRVAHDIAYSVVRYEEAVTPLTHNRVADTVSYTGQSLYTEYHVRPSTLLVGKMVLYDVTVNEFIAIASTLANIRKIGGRENVYGSVRVKILGVKGGRYETLTSYEIAKEILSRHKGKLMDPAQYMDEIESLLEKHNYITGVHDALATALDEKRAVELWEDSLDYAQKIVEFLKSVVGESVGTEKKSKNKKKR